MKPSRLLFVLTAVLLTIAPVAADFNPVRYVNPFIGTDFHGHTFPGAVVPFGMVQLSPDTRLSGWDGCSGYHYSDSVIYGFSHTHLSGTGASDYGDVLLMPVIASDQFDNQAYASPFQKKTEAAEPGYYRVSLDKPGVLAELSATARVGWHRYTYMASSTPRLILDLEHRDQVIESWLKFVSPTEVHGLRRSKRWAKDQYLYFVMRFSAPVRAIKSQDPGQAGQTTISGQKLKVIFEFEPLRQPLLVKVALSGVSAQGALLNMEKEAPGWDFEPVRYAAMKQWSRELGRIEVSGGSAAQMTSFYTALYHCFIHPGLWNDVDGNYRGHDGRIRKAEDFEQYTVFSLWDTFRTQHPLLNLIMPRRSRDFIRSFLSIYQSAGLLPVWELSANETFCMIGYHSVPVILDAWVKGIRDFDAKLALEAMKTSAGKDHFGLDAYRRYGYIGGDQDHEGVSKTLEYAYDDWCIARFAAELDLKTDHDLFMQRAQSYRNLFDAGTGFMRPRLNGAWKTDFDPSEVDNNFTEANSWQYSFFVPHDVSGLIELHGGQDKLEQKLDQLFVSDSRLGGRQLVDITGLIGQYAHGNEPSHNTAYLYNFLGKPWKTQRTVRRIMDELYSDRPDGLCGNEDCGQMSAWLVMSAMGIFPFTPGDPEYLIGTPWFEHMTIHLENGRQFTVNAPGASSQKFYIQSAVLNGQALSRSFLSHETVAQGGQLDLTMGPQANPDWGSAPTDRPVRSLAVKPIVPIPVISASGPTFRKQTQVRIQALQPGLRLHYSLDGTLPTSRSTAYSQELPLTRTTTVKAVAIAADGRSSMAAEATFQLIPDSWTIQTLTAAHPQYNAGGPQTLIDGLRGRENFRLGGWLGYQGQDFTAVIDLGTIRSIRRLTAGFLQDTDSWILLPKNVEFLLSRDGQNFSSSGTVGHHIADDNLKPQRLDMDKNLTGEARFIKVIAKNYGSLPAWHLGAGQPAYIFIDEIIVE